MAGLTAALRFLHFAATVALAGEFAFFLYVARPLLRGSWPAAGTQPGLRERLGRVAPRWLALLLVSGLLWFLVQTAVMSGASLAGAFDPGTLAAALRGTLFGRVWTVRLALAAGLGAALFFLRRAPSRREAVLLGVCAMLASALLATLAGTGHAAAEEGTDRLVHVSADIVHLLAAGAWLGALPGLAFVLARAAGAGGFEFAARATQRFSTLGLASVGALVLTGAVNTWYTVGSVPALFGTGYGQLLCAKLALFAAMVTLAAVNRLRWTPRISAAAPSAVLCLRRNAIAEAALGFAVLGIVGALGIAVPALHEQVTWPFPFTLDWDVPRGSREIFLTAVVTVSVAGAIAAAGALAKKQEIAIGGIAAAVMAALTLVAFFVVRAHPTTYLESPASYDTASIMRGAPLYAEHCAACHGPYGNGDGPLADSLPRRPPNLPTILSVRREGDLLWSIEHGVAGTSMPGFGDRISESRLWDVFNFVRAQAGVDAGRRMTALVDPPFQVVAPDFTFQIGRGAQEALAQERGRDIVLLVFYSRPKSLARLRALADHRLRFNRLGVRVIAVPMREADALPREARGVDAAMLAQPDADLAAAYAMFTRTILGPPAAPYHVEFLIDRQGYLRARWVLPGKDAGWNPMWQLLRQAVLLDMERSGASAPRRHAH